LIVRHDETPVSQHGHEAVGRNERIVRGEVTVTGAGEPERVAAEKRVEMDPIVWIDGRMVDASVPHVSALDRGFTLADGLFETMRVYGGRIFRRDAHLARLADACHTMRMAHPDGLGEAVEGAVRAATGAGMRDARLRLTVTRGAGAAGLAPSPGATPTVVVTVHPLPRPDETLYERGITAQLARTRLNERSATAGLKTLDYTEMVIALAEARDAGADDALLLDTQEHLAEATASNLFIVSGGMLFTPPLSCGVLPGITRAATLECARALGLSATERELLTNDLLRADESFLTNSVREIVPLVGVGGTAIGSGWPGPVTRLLMERYAELVRQECST
jgi:branched-chain amino acid aminotransferase